MFSGGEGVRRLGLEDLIKETSDPMVVNQLRYAFLDCHSPTYVPFKKEELLKSRLELSINETELQPGDIIYDASTDSHSNFRPSGYGMFIPSPLSSSVLNFVQRFGKENRESHGIRRLFNAVEFVNANLPYVRHIGYSTFRTLMFGPSEEEEAAFLSTLDILYDKKLFSIDEFIERRIPAICISQAIVLSVLISNDEEFSRSGLKPFISAGLQGYLHAMVRVAFTDLEHKKDFKYNEYVLDPANNWVYIYLAEHCSKLEGNFSNKDVLVRLEPDDEVCHPNKKVNFKQLPQNERCELGDNYFAILKLGVLRTQ